MLGTGTRFTRLTLLRIILLPLVHLIIDISRQITIRSSIIIIEVNV